MELLRNFVFASSLYIIALITYINFSTIPPNVESIGYIEYSCSFQLSSLAILISLIC